MGRVLLGDGKTALPIQGVGTVHCVIDGQDLLLDNVRYVPELFESIYSLFLHIKNPGHSLNSSFENGLFIGFPGFNTKALVGEHDIYIDAAPKFPINVYNASSTNSLSPTTTNYSVCRKLQDFQSRLFDETSYIDNVLLELSRYYNTIKTKRQLNLEVPAGFRQESIHNRHLLSYLTSTSNLENTLSPLNLLDESNFDEKVSSSTETPTSNTISPSSTFVTPIIHSVDKVSSSLPKSVTMSEDFIRASMGF